MTLQYHSQHTGFMPRVIKTSRRRRESDDPAPIEGAPISGMAWACLATSLLGWVFGIPLVLSLIFGMMALSEIRHHRGRVRGKGVVYLGFVIDAAVFLLLFTTFVLPLILGYHEKVRRVHCQENLKTIGIACRDYAKSRRDRRFPDDLGIFIDRGELLGRHYVCAGGYRTEPPRTGDDVRQGQCSYTYVGKGLRLNSPNIKRTVLAHDRESHRHEPFMNVLLADGRVYGANVGTIEEACEKHGWFLPGSTFKPPPVRVVKKRRPRRTFAADKCELRLPSSDWEWDASGAKPGIRATGIQPDRGLLLDLAIEPVNSTRAITAELMDKFEQGVLAKPGTVKLSRRPRTFRGVPAFELTYTLDDGRTKAVSCVFCANRRVYMVQVSGSTADMAKATDLDAIMNSFLFTSRPWYRK